MAQYYLEKLVITGSGKEPSSVSFAPGLNIVRGPSNTGKSFILDCVDYLFGKDELNLGEEAGYDTVGLRVVASGGPVMLQRGIGSSRIQVVSENADIPSGDYRVKATPTDPGINKVWFKLIGLEDVPRIIKNTSFSRQRLGWRTISHTFLISEVDVIRTGSILLGEKSFQHTAIMSAILFLLTGENQSDEVETDAKNIREAKKKAVIEYISGNLRTLEERIVNLTKSKEDNDQNLQEAVDMMIGEVAEIEKEISFAIGASKSLLRNIYEVERKLTESNSFIERCSVLKGQYLSDIERLGFVVEGELREIDYPQAEQCPFCDKVLDEPLEETYYVAADAELSRIRLQLKDLEETTGELHIENNVLKKQASELNVKKNEIEKLLKEKLKPRVTDLKQKITDFQKAIEIENEIVVIRGLAGNMEHDINEKVAEEVVITYSSKELFTEAIVDNFSSRITSILKECQYPGINSAYFDLKDFDVVVDGKRKRDQGKGFRAILNTVLAAALMEDLVTNGSYAPGLLLIDSPVLNLTEPREAGIQANLFDEEGADEKSAIDTMKSSLFKYFVKNQEFGQVIIIENKIPDIDYKNTRIIDFTGIRGKGRYGLLNGVYNSEDAEL